MKRGVASVIIECLDFHIFLNLQKCDKLKMFSLINESEDLLTIFLELNGSHSDAL